ncbi:MAG: YcxB family protein [Pyrinomonadaceae bacterium]
MSDGQKISIRMHNEANDFFRVLWHQRRWKLLVAILLIGLVLGSFSFYAAMATPLPGSVDKRWIVYATSLFVPLFAGAVMYLSLKGAARKAAESAELVTMTFDSDGVEINGPRSNAKSEWSSFKKILETPTDFLFYVQSNIFYGVPKRFFDSTEEVGRVRALIAEEFHR